MATRQAGVKGELSEHVRVGLARLCDSLDSDAQLSPFASRPIEALIISGLVARLRLDARFASEPALAARPLHPPLIVTGLPRSGTTLLHRLLSLGARPVPLWELYSPLPDVRRPREGIRQLLGWARLGGLALDGLHAVGEELPDECSYLLRLDMRSQLFWAIAPVHSYLEWLLEEDPAPTCALYRRALLHLQEVRPGRLTLKCPSHALHLPALLAAVPEARVICTHRDPDEAIPSSDRLLLALHQRVDEGVDLERSRQSNHARLARQGAATIASASLAALHLGHHEIVGDPVGVVRRVHAHFGIAPPDEAPLHAYLAANPRPPPSARHASTEGFDAYRQRFAALLAPTDDPSP